MLQNLNIESVSYGLCGGDGTVGSRLAIFLTGGRNVRTRNDWSGIRDKPGGHINLKYLNEIAICF